MLADTAGACGVGELRGYCPCHSQHPQSGRCRLPAVPFSLATHYGQILKSSVVLYGSGDVIGVRAGVGGFPAALIATVGIFLPSCVLVTFRRYIIPCKCECFGRRQRGFSRVDGGRDWGSGAGGDGWHPDGASGTRRPSYGVALQG